MSNALLALRPRTANGEPRITRTAAATFLLSAALLTGCGHSHRAKAIRYPAPPPPVVAGKSPPRPQPAPAPAEAPKYETHGKVLFTEEGMASWYGAPYHNRRAANGEVYDMNAMTAAHRTLPLNSVVRVTNLKNGETAIVRITDRGPFVENRIIDLSVAAAKKLDVWRPGTARVRIDVLESPAPLDRGGRWAVQLGGFDQKQADRIKRELADRFRHARVQDFPSPVGDWWVRVRVPDDDKARAEEVARNAPAPRENTFLVRLN